MIYYFIFVWCGCNTLVSCSAFHSIVFDGIICCSSVVWIVYLLVSGWKSADIWYWTRAVALCVSVENSFGKENETSKEKTKFVSLTVNWKIVFKRLNLSIGHGDEGKVQRGSSIKRRIHCLLASLVCDKIMNHIGISCLRLSKGERHECIRTGWTGQPMKTRNTSNRFQPIFEALLFRRQTTLKSSERSAKTKI